LVDSARSLIAREGASALTMRNLATEAGCSVGLPYKVFADRKDLVVEVCHAEFAKLGDGYEQLVQRAGAHTVGANLAWFAALLLDSPAVALTPEIFADPDLAKAVGERVHQSGIGPGEFELQIAGYLELEQGAGRISPQVDARAFGFLIGGAIHNLVVSGAAWHRPPRAQIDAWLHAVATTLATVPEA
jgi:AcrR family transcriptional regulator